LKAQDIVKVQGKDVDGREVLFIHIPKDIVEKLGIRKGDHVVVEARKRSIIIKKLR